MKVDLMITCQKMTITKHIEQEIEKELAVYELHDIGSYGWADENTPDQQFVGHAMWQLDPPLQIEYNSAFGEASVRHSPTEKQEVLAISGADFEGLMRLSRISIGLGLWNQQLAENSILEDNDHFWLHYLSAVVLLNAASDRLREFFVMALFQQKSDVYDKKDGTFSGNKYKWYQTPFIEAEAANAKISDAEDLLGKLSSSAKKIYEYRLSRNKIVHEVATKIGHRERELVQRRRTRFDEQQGSNMVLEKPEHADVLDRFAQAKESHKVELQSSIDEVVSWYKTLIQASSYAFEIENNERQEGRGRSGVGLKLKIR